MIMNLWVPLIARKFLSSWVTGGFSRWTQLHGISFLISWFVSNLNIIIFYKYMSFPVKKKKKTRGL
jgi:hypothetical protein